MTAVRFKNDVNNSDQVLISIDSFSDTPVLFALFKTSDGTLITSFQETSNLFRGFKQSGLLFTSDGYAILAG